VRNRRFALFDSLRALAALGVLVFHAATTSMKPSTAWYGGLVLHLNVGVTLFFLISGFLLYRPYAEAIDTGSPLPSIRRYARRRFLRIVPAYWVALTLLACWPGLLGVFTSDWWVYYGFLQSYRLAWLWGGIRAAWSLSVEAAFYLLLPFLGAALAKLCRGRTPRVAAGVQLGTFGAMALFGIGFHGFVQYARLVDLYAVLPGMLAWFAAGMSLAVASVRHLGRERDTRWTRSVLEHPGACWTLAFAIYLGIAFAPAFPRPFTGREYTPLAHTVEHVLYAAVALLVMLPAVFGEAAGGGSRRFLASRTLAWIGAVSYGVFLWHQPLMVALDARGASRGIPGWPILALLLASLPLTFACAWLSYRLIERPALGLSARGR